MRLTDKARAQLRALAPYILLAVGAALLVTGILSGGARVTLRKAIIVCMECIGLG